MRDDLEFLLGFDAISLCPTDPKCGPSRSLPNSRLTDYTARNDNDLNRNRNIYRQPVTTQSDRGNRRREPARESLSRNEKQSTGRCRSRTVRVSAIMESQTDFRSERGEPKTVQFSVESLASRCWLRLSWHGMTVLEIGPARRGVERSVA